MSSALAVRRLLIVCAVVAGCALGAPAGAFAQDTTPPTTRDDVPSTYVTSAPRAVTLTATDPGGGLPATGAIKYTIGTNPTDPTTDPAAATYDPAAKPTLVSGQKISYFATDSAGNPETPKTSAALRVLANATNYYTPASAGATGAQPHSVAIGDLNGDGRPDLATADYASSTVTVITRNTTDTGWDTPVTVYPGGGPISVAIADLDGDGQNDLATADYASSTVTVITRNTTNTGWDTPVTAGATGSRPRSVAIGDLNGDGQNDLATADALSDRVTVITRNTTNTGWDAPVTAGTTGSLPVSVVIGDLDGDGRNDLASVDLGPNSVTVITRNADNTGWDAPVTAGTTGADPNLVAIGDLNGDGRNDLAAADSGSSSGSVTVIARNAANTGWDAPVIAGATAGAPVSVAIGDLNGDGQNDLATADLGPNRVTVITRNATSDGWDTPVIAGTTGLAPRSVAIGDLNGDGRPDLATADQSSATVTVLYAGYDGVEPITTDDVPTTYTNQAPVTVTLTVTDTGGSGVKTTTYETVAADGTTGATETYDPANRPTLADGEKLTYRSTDNAGNVEAGKTSGVAKIDTVNPSSTDDVPTTVRNAPVSVTLTATDSGGAQVSEIRYLTGSAPADPSAAQSGAQLYDPAHKPVLQDGEKIRYFATDTAGNTEAPHSSAAAKVDQTPPTTSDDVPAQSATGPVTVTLTATDTGSGVAATTYRIVAATGTTGAQQTYDAAAKPRLADGEKLRYASTDAAGNTETAHDSPVVHVDQATPTPAPAPTPSPTPTPTPTTPTDTGATGVSVTNLTTRLAFALNQSLLRCVATGGTATACEVRITSRLRAGNVPVGALLATGTVKGSGPAYAVAVTLTRAGEAALKARPRGVPVVVKTIITTSTGRRVTSRQFTRLQNSSQVTLRLSGHGLALPKAVRVRLKLAARYLSTAKSVSCVAHTDPAGTSAADRALTLRAARDVCHRLTPGDGSGKTTFTIGGRGHDQPAARGTSAVARRADRRVVITIKR